MSIRLVAAVLDHYPHGDARKLVLLSLAEQADEATWICWPAAERLAHRSCVSERHVKRIVDSLEAEGLVDVVRGGGRKKTNRYRVRFDILRAMPSLVEINRPQDDPESGFEPVDNPVERRVTPGHRCPEKGDIAASGKGDTAMSPEPLEPLLNRHLHNGRGQAVVAGFVGDLSRRWSSR